MLRKYSFGAGFTLIELMIVIAIMGILASVAVPQYNQYIKKAKFADVISRTAAYKSAVHLCVQEINDLTGCSNGMNGVPVAITAPDVYVQSLSVTDGLITARATSLLEERQYILRPTYNAASNSLLWNVEGSCIAALMCDD